MSVASTAAFRLLPFRRFPFLTRSSSLPDLLWYSQGSVTGNATGGDMRVQHPFPISIAKKSIVSLEWASWDSSQDVNVLFRGQTLQIPGTEYGYFFRDAIDLVSNLVDTAAGHREYDKVFFGIGPAEQGVSFIGFESITQNISAQTLNAACGGYVWLNFPDQLVRYFPA